MLSGQQDDTSCRKFQQLIRQEKLLVSTRISASPLFLEEALFPSVVVTNRGSNWLEIPDFENISGIHIDSYPGLNYFEAARPSNESLICSFPTVSLAPGEEREFVLRQHQDRFFERSIEVERPRVLQAMANEGKGTYALHLGRMQLSGSYDIVKPAILDYNCLQKKAIPEDETGRCQLAAIVRVADEVWLLSGAQLITYQQYSNLLNIFNTFQEGNRERFLAYRAPFRIMKLETKARFALSRSAAPVSSEQFSIVQDNGKKLSFEAIRQTVEAQRAEEARLPKRVTLEPRHLPR